MDHLDERFDFAVELCRKAGEFARTFFDDRSALVVDRKGTQDWVSEADRKVELLIRNHLNEAWPEDGVYGEEHADKPGTSGFDWVIDPIDGTTNFINDIPAWTIVLAGVADGQTQVGVMYEPNVDEMYAACRGKGATLNGKSMRAASGVGLASGTVAVGYSNRVEAANILPVVAGIVESGGMFHRNASGALSIAYVAAGRLLGYLEEHMNAWDCLAGQLMVEEAGGRVEFQNADEMIRSGGRVVVGADDIFDEIQALADKAWGI